MEWYAREKERKKETRKEKRKRKKKHIQGKEREEKSLRRWMSSLTTTTCLSNLPTHYNQLLHYASPLQPAVYIFPPPLLHAPLPPQHHP